MKQFRRLLTTFLTGAMLFGAQAFAAGIDHFEVILSPESAKVGESLDMTIKAVDKNNNVVTDYNGTVLILSDTDEDATLPSILDEYTYEFTNTDQGVVKFENSVSFQAVGKQEISIYDLEDESVVGIGKADITEAEVATNTDISILFPESGLTLGEDTLKVSGETTKNHAVRVMINDSLAFETTTNNDGLFEGEATGLKSGENKIVAQILNADKQVIGESTPVKVMVELNKLFVKNVKLTPTEIESEGIVKIEVISREGLKEVKTIINDTLTTLVEESNGNYVASIYAPKKSGDYVVDVILTDDLGHETKEVGAAVLKVKPTELQSATPETTQTPALESANTDPLAIKNLKLLRLKSKSVLSWDSVETAEAYNVYRQSSEGDFELFQKVTEPKIEVAITGDAIKHEMFAVKAIAKNEKGLMYEGDLSEATKIQTGPELIILFIISLISAGLLFSIGRRKA